MAIQFLITAPASLLLLKFAAAKCIYHYSIEEFNQNYRYRCINMKDKDEGQR